MTFAAGRSNTVSAIAASDSAIDDDSLSAKAGATLSNTASVTSSAPRDPNGGNNGATVSTSVIAKR